MRFLTSPESAAWLRAQKIRALDANSTPCVIGDYEILCAAPANARAQQRLARDLVAWLGDFQIALFWLTDWPFCQGDEMELVSSLRRGHGEHKPLIDTPGLVFSANERDELTGWIYLMMAFGWDGYLFPSPFQGSMFQISHEDFIWLLSADPKSFTESQRIAHQHELKIHRESGVV